MSQKPLQNRSKTFPKTYIKPIIKPIQKPIKKPIQKPLQKPLQKRPPKSPPKIINFPVKTHRNSLFLGSQKSLILEAIRQARIIENFCVLPSPNPYPIRRLSHIDKTSIALYALPVIRQPRISQNQSAIPSPNPYPIKAIARS